MAIYLRPKRGKRSTAETQNIILKKGEIFFEVPDGGAGTGVGKIKMGDGITDYINLPYFLEQKNINVSEEKIIFTQATSTNTTTLLNALVSNTALKTIIGVIKQLFSVVVNKTVTNENNIASINSTLNNKISTNSSAQLDSLELTGNVPFIDFHFGTTTSDYTSRIAEYQQGNLTLEGALYVSRALYQDGKQVSTTDHTHDGRYYTETEVNTLLNAKSATSHTHDDRYFTESEVTTKLNGKANSSHTHDDRYYTETEVNSLLNGKSNTGHTHSSKYSYGTSAPSSLTSGNLYFVYE